jgi:hypothetical protein
MISPEELAADEIKMLLNQSSFNDTVTFENGLFNVMGNYSRLQISTFKYHCKRS